MDASERYGSIEAHMPHVINPNLTHVDLLSIYHIRIKKIPYLNITHCLGLSAKYNDKMYDQDGPKQLNGIPWRRQNNNG